MDLSYKGTAYHGWQIQPNANTVQQEIEHALSVVLRQKTQCMGSGRTDTGVHASQQIVHFDITQIDTSLDQLAFRLNSVLPKDISINRIRPVLPEAHARFDAKRRTYHYHLHRNKNPFVTGQSYLFTKPINTAAIEEAIEIIKTAQNFQAFSKVHTEVNNYNCEMFDIWWKAVNDHHTFCVSANRFLRGMVRAIVGTLLEVGTERIPPRELSSILESKDRSKAGRSVPAEGLFLTEVLYPESIYLDK